MKRVSHCSRYRVSRGVRRSLALAIGTASLTGTVAFAQDGSEQRPVVPESPVLLIERDPLRPSSPSDPPPTIGSVEVRRIDGRDNHPEHFERGGAGTPLRRIAPTSYADGVSAMRDDGLPAARAVSNALAGVSSGRVRAYGPSDYVWQWGQFLDHDLSLTEGTSPVESADLPIPSGDPFFDPEGTGTATMPFNRSIHVEDERGVRQQLNEITHWIDASNVYGSDEARAEHLRTNDQTGRLRTSIGDLLPYSTGEFANAGGNGSHLFIAGDVRANEQIGLTAMHTLFVREHNRLAERFLEADNALDGDAVYEKARRVVGALMQRITYDEYLPVLLGRSALPPYRGYRPEADATLANLFTTALYRYGHSAVGDRLLRLDEDGQPIGAGPLALRDAFFRPGLISTEGDLEPILRGLAAQACQPIDLSINEELRNFLFGVPGEGGFDLASLNIQRGRDHGLASYNSARLAYGLKPRNNFTKVTDDRDVRRRLRSVYGRVDDIDAWIGALAEPTHRGMVGELLFTAMREQFILLRDGDRFWHANTLSRDEEAELGTLADVIRRNTSIGAELPDRVFVVRRGRS